MILWDLVRREFISALIWHSESILGFHYDVATETVISYSAEGVIKMWKL